MILTALTRTLLVSGLALGTFEAWADTISLPQAVEMSLAADPRIKEREQLIESARALLQEAKANNGWRINANAFVGIAPEVKGGFYQNGATSGTTPRRSCCHLSGE